MCSLHRESTQKNRKLRIEINVYETKLKIAMFYSYFHSLLFLQKFFCVYYIINILTRLEIFHNKQRIYSRFVLLRKTTSDHNKETIFKHYYVSYGCYSLDKYYKKYHLEQSFLYLLQKYLNETINGEGFQQRK